MVCDALIHLTRLAGEPSIAQSEEEVLCLLRSNELHIETIAVGKFTDEPEKRFCELMEKTSC